MFGIDTIKIVSLMHYAQEKILLKADHLHNVTIAGHTLKNLPVYERGDKGLQIVFQEYQDSLL